MKLMPLRYAGNCTSCGTRVQQGVEAWYDPATKVTCVGCRPVGEQLAADLGSDDVAAQPAWRRSARTDLQKGTELEQMIADVFTAHGYQVRTNVKLDGRNGTPHEIDVLAQKSDELLTLSVAIECKAWTSPIDKAVISKFADVCQDLGIGHALVVSLNGTQPGALAMAQQRGVIVWGPDEIEPHLGKTSVLGLQNRSMVEEVGFARLLDVDAARQVIDKESGGRLGFGKEDIVWSGAAWIPVAVVQLTLMELGVFRRKTASSQMWAVYDLIGSTFVTRLDNEPERAPVQLDGPQIEPKLKVVEPAKRLDAVVARYEKVTTDDAKTKYRSQMRDLGVPDRQVPTTGTSTPFLYPVHLAIARRNGNERIIAIDAYRSRVDPDLGHELSKAMATVRASLKIE